MKFLVILSALLAVGAAKPTLLTTAPIRHQYHAQDELGQYTYGYSGGPSAKVETKTADGVTRGAYSYIDSNGIVQSVNYQADSVNGFRVAATNLPVASAGAPVVAPAVVAAAPAVVSAPVVAAAPAVVQDTPEVVVARAQHLAAKAAVVASHVPVVVAASSVPVVDTPEVAVEKSRHLAAVEVQKAVVSTAVDDSALHDDGSYKINPLEDDGEYRGEPGSVVVTHSALGPVAAVVTDDDSHLHDDGSYKPVIYGDDEGQYRGEGETVIVGTNLVSALTPAKTVIASTPLVRSYAVSSPLIGARYAVAAPVSPLAYHSPVVSHLALPAARSQYHAQDELGQYSYGYTGGPSAKQEVRTADGITRGGYSYIDANGIVQSVSYVSDPVNGFRVAATNLPVAPSA